MLKWLTALGAFWAAQVAVAQVVGWWTFEEGTPGQVPVVGPSILDVSGNGHNGSGAGELVYADGRATPVALDFRGDGGRVRIPDSADFHLRGGFTLECYLWLESVGTSCCNKRYLLFRGDRRAGRDPWYLAVNDDGSLAVQVWDGAEEIRLDADEEIQLGEWTHVAGVFDADAGALRLYLNHELIAQLGGVPPPAGDLVPSQAPGVAIGNSRFTADEGVEGGIDEARISAGALSPDDFLPLIKPCRADLYGYGELTIFDFFVFQGYFGLGDLRADFDGDGELTVFDFLEFQTEFSTACQ